MSHVTRSTSRIVGRGKFRYEERTDWVRLPEGYRLGEVAGVAVNSRDDVYLFSRCENPVIIVSPDGEFRGSWGAGLFVHPHLIFIGPDDSVYCVDDWGNTVRKFAPEGKLLMELKPSGGPSDTGYVTGDFKSIVRPGPPFNCPTDVALSSAGELYVSDGYGNARVHKFSSDGELLFSWGEPGDGPGQFEVVHAVCVDPSGRVFVADRQNKRIQVFSPDGEFLTQWTDVWWPCAMCMDAASNMYVAEVGGILMARNVDLGQPAPRITIRDSRGGILAEWTAEDPYGEGRYFAPHDIAMDSRGDLYVGEVVHSFSLGKAPEDAPVVRKYVR